MWIEVLNMPVNLAKGRRDRDRYDWGEWLSRPSFYLRKGEHYRISTSSMMQQVRNRATKEGIRVSLNERGNGILVEVTYRPGTEEDEVVSAEQGARKEVTE